ncbi:MAG: tRNA 2-thiouridine(34) synthase MnmA [Deltaproteobacteria bacterium]|nr:tRNA 2-thiouridine(34) synthase MnmA [Deltaproteobacteria bacterium]
MTVLQKNRVVVAMSGGVDSSVAALLLKEQGLEVIGISMKTHEGNGDDNSRSQTCCTAQDLQDARQVCQQLDLPFYPLNFKDEFRENVMQYFASEYGQGRTPNPCVLCNDKLKFSSLLEKARQLGAYYVATGHYVRKSRDSNGRYHLMKARDLNKDQSYFLFGLDQQQLEHILFPVGRYMKEEVRGLAEKAGLKVSQKPESQEICFVTTGHYSDFISNNFPQYRGKRGMIVDREGHVLGEHDGIHAFTIGQRRGLGVSAAERLYVTGILPEENKVVLGPQEALMKNSILVKEVRWVQRDQISVGTAVETQIRYRHPPTPSVISRLEGSMALIDFKRPDGAITPGQVAVFYRGEELLGGGWIEKGID